MLQGGRFHCVLFKGPLNLHVLCGQKAIPQSQFGKYALSSMGDMSQLGWFDFSCVVLGNFFMTSGVVKDMSNCFLFQARMVGERGRLSKLKPV